MVGDLSARAEQLRGCLMSHRHHTHRFHEASAVLIEHGASLTLSGQRVERAARGARVRLHVFDMPADEVHVRAEQCQPDEPVEVIPRDEAEQQAEQPHEQLDKEERESKHSEHAAPAAARRCAALIVSVHAGRRMCEGEADWASRGGNTAHITRLA